MTKSQIRFINSQKSSFTLHLSEILTSNTEVLRFLEGAAIGFLPGFKKILIGFKTFLLGIFLFSSVC